MKLLAFRRSFFRPLFVYSVVASGLAFLPGCAFLGIKKQVQAIDAQAAVGVKIQPMPTGAPVYVAALSGKTILGSQKTEPNGLAVILVPEKTASCTLVAFQDVNGNRTLDAGEPSALLENIPPAALSNPDRRVHLPSVRLIAGGAASHVGLQMPTKGSAAEAGLNIAIGEVARPGDARFSEANGVEGLWEPHTALKQGNLGVYFMEPYQPGKIPVVFVHGIGGSPRDLAKLMASIDHSRYQVWFYYYPSGFRLAKAANVLSTILDILLEKHGVTRINVITHSMGGLVSRSAILGLQKNYGLAPVDRFIALSTPWGGDGSASSALRVMKDPLPAWIDMNPGSAFIKSIWATSLPAKTRFFMIYGYDTKRLPWLSNDNDSIINERTAADPRAQAAAERLFTAPYDHMGVLTAPETIGKVNEFLALPGR